MEDLYLPPRSRKTLQQINQSGEGTVKNKIFIILYYVLHHYTVCFIVQAEEGNEKSYLLTIVTKVKKPEVRLKAVMMNVLKKEVDRELHLEKT